MEVEGCGMLDHTPMVEIRRAFLKYGSSNLVLNGVNLTVKSNEIYGLLGPSGCGKTTLLKCILGQTQLDSGEVKIGVGQHKDIGYMPQEVALFPEFTIREIFVFYGRLFGLHSSRINQRSDELCKLLDLPEWNRTIGSLSGGQQRRTSFAVAMLHDPKLLILDEPTVGVDTLLAHSMWEYLLRLTIQGKTIIITTHYIEEAKNCNTISLMRNGMVLSESSPSELMVHQNSTNLEDAFLKLCQQQENIVAGAHTVKEKTQPPLQNNEWFNENRFIAQLIKNVCWMKRNVPIMFFLLLLPALQSFLFCASFGQDPLELNVAFVTDELIYNTNVNQCNDRLFVDSYDIDYSECNVSTPFTCQYAQELETKMNLIPYSNMEFAESDVSKNKVWGVVYLSNNFTTSIIERMKDRTSASEFTLENGAVTVRMDMSNYIIGSLLRRQITKSFGNALTKFLMKCGIPPEVADIPIRLNDAVFSTNNPVYAHSGLPGFICSFCFYFTMMFTSGAVMMEKLVGLLERSRVAGMTHFEIVGAHLVVQVFLMAAQTLVMLFVFYICFSNPFVGDTKLIIALLFAVEFVGITYGFLLTEIFSTDRMVSYAGIGTTLAVFSLGGIIWPLEGAHIVIRSWVWAFPVAPAVESYNSITAKGYSFSHYAVYQGFASCLVWSIVFTFLAILMAKLKKRPSVSTVLRNSLMHYFKLKKQKTDQDSTECTVQSKVNIVGTDTVMQNESTS